MPRFGKRKNGLKLWSQRVFFLTFMAILRILLDVLCSAGQSQRLSRVGSWISLPSIKAATLQFILQISFSSSDARFQMDKVFLMTIKVAIEFKCQDDMLQNSQLALVFLIKSRLYIVDLLEPSSDIREKSLQAPCFFGCPRRSKVPNRHNFLSGSGSSDASFSSFSSWLCICVLNLIDPEKPFSQETI